jgi:methionyl aminopeptidase
LWCFQNGYHGDHAYSFEKEVAPETKKLLQVTKESLYVGIHELSLGTCWKMWNAIQNTESHGYGVVRELVGHGVGQKMHEDPEMLITVKRKRNFCRRNGWLLNR